MSGKKKRSSKGMWTSVAIVAAIFVALGAGLVYLVSNDKGGGKKVFVAKVDLVKPDMPDKPPPPPKEQPPAPEAQKKEAIVAPQDMAPSAGPKGDNKPIAEGPLGLEGEGGAGGDGFGLAARGKGGRDITTVGTGTGTGGARVGMDQGSILRRYAGYFHLVQEEMKKVAFKRLDEAGIFPKGKLEATVQIVMDETGTITECRVVRSCGNAKVDEAVKESLRFVKLSEPPPKDVPRRMNVKMTTQG